MSASPSSKERTRTYGSFRRSLSKIVRNTLNDDYYSDANHADKTKTRIDHTTDMLMAYLLADAMQINPKHTLKVKSYLDDKMVLKDEQLKRAEKHLKKIRKKMNPASEFHELSSAANKVEELNPTTEQLSLTFGELRTLFHANATEEMLDNKPPHNMWSAETKEKWVKARVNSMLITTTRKKPDEFPADDTVLNGEIYQRIAQQMRPQKPLELVSV